MCVRTKGASLVVRSIEVPWVGRVRCGTISWPHAVSACPMASTFKRDTLRRIGSRRIKRRWRILPRAFPITRRAIYSRYLQPLVTAARCPSGASPSVRGESPAKPSGAVELCHARRRGATFAMQLAKEESTSALAAAVAATGNAGGVRTHPPRCGRRRVQA